MDASQPSSWTISLQDSYSGKRAVRLKAITLRSASAGKWSVIGSNFKSTSSTSRSRSSLLWCIQRAAPSQESASTYYSKWTTRSSQIRMNCTEMALDLSSSLASSRGKNTMLLCRLTGAIPTGTLRLVAFPPTRSSSTSRRPTLGGSEVKLYVSVWCIL